MGLKGLIGCLNDDHGFWLWLNILPLCFTGASTQVVLTQSEPAVKNPGQSHKLSCRATGFDVNGYWMDWVRQKPGQGLEWLASYLKPSHKYYSPAIEGRFTASKDSSSFYLQMNNLKDEDTAVYYCARDTVRKFPPELKQKPFASFMVMPVSYTHLTLPTKA